MIPAAQDEIEQIKSYYGDRFAQVFSRPLVSSSISPKILWIKNHLPDVYFKTHKFLTASSFLTAKMTGRYCIDKYLIGSFAPLYDESGINETQCSLFCRPEQLAEVTLATDVIGTVTPEAAARTGLLPGIQSSHRHWGFRSGIRFLRRFLPRGRHDPAGFYLLFHL